MLDLLCISDLHLGERYSFLDRSRVSDGSWQGYRRSLLPFYYGVGALAGLGPRDPPKVRVNTLVLLGDIFELATARLATAAQAGRDFFWWLFQWLEPNEVVYVPGNHDHVMWMWWKTAAKSQKAWWQLDPQAAKADLAAAYGNLPRKTSDPRAPETIGDDPLRADLIKTFFGDLSPARLASFRFGYPAYCGPAASPPGYPTRAHSTIFSHGHLNDPTFVRPVSSDAEIASVIMHARTWSWGDAKADSLEDLEASTWKYTHQWWYPSEAETPVGERLYLFTERFGSNNPCQHLCQTPPDDYPREPAADLAPNLNAPFSSANDFYTFLHAALGTGWHLQPRLYVYGHTHHGGAAELHPPLILACNTGGWLSIVKDRPIHTHLFAIDDRGLAQVKRVGFEA